jgi:hypothetical protein
MACDLDTVLTSVCDTGFGKVDDPVLLLQIIAQLEADHLSELDPGADTSLSAIRSRACASGIAKVTNPDDLLRLIAQLLCDQQEVE